MTSTQGDLALVENEPWPDALPKVRHRLKQLEELFSKVGDASTVADTDTADHAITGGGGWQTCGLSVDVQSPLIGDMHAAFVAQVGNSSGANAIVRLRLRVEGVVQAEELYFHIPDGQSRALAGRFYTSLLATAHEDTVELVVDSDVAVTVEGASSTSVLVVSSWVGNFMLRSVYDPAATGRVDNASNLSNGTNSIGAASVYSHATPGQQGYNAFHNVARINFPAAPLHGTRVIRTDLAWPNEFVAHTGLSRWIGIVEETVVGYSSGNLTAGNYLLTLGGRTMSATIGEYAAFDSIIVTGATWCGTAHSDGDLELRSGGTKITGSEFSHNENVGRLHTLNAPQASAGVLAIYNATGVIQNGTAKYRYRRDGGATSA